MEYGLNQTKRNLPSFVDVIEEGYVPCDLRPYHFYTFIFNGIINVTHLRINSRIINVCAFLVSVCVNASKIKN